MVNEAILSNWKLEALICSTDYKGEIVSKNKKLLVYQADRQDFLKISQQTNPEGILAIVHFPNSDFCQLNEYPSLPDRSRFYFRWNSRSRKSRDDLCELQIGLVSQV